jgi:hypothetical protein
MSRYPLKGMADEVESHGRFGDSELVHLNPIEVAGLASLSPTGKLTTNPVTGKKEAFLPLLIPIIASYGGSALAASAGASMVGAAIAGGAASGLATYAQTGDAERGLYSGIMGAGMGAAAGAAGEAARGIADPALLDPTLLEAGINAGAGADAAAGVMGPMPPAGYAPPVDPATVMGPQPPAGYTPPAADTGNLFMTGNGPTEGGFGQALKDPFGKTPKGENLVNQMMKPSSMLPIAMGGNQLMELDAQDAQGREDAEEEEKRKKRLKQAYGDLQAAYGKAQPGIARGVSPYRSGMSGSTPRPSGPDGYAQGGIVNLLRGGSTGRTYYGDYGEYGRNGGNQYRGDGRGPSSAGGNSTSRNGSNGYNAGSDIDGDNWNGGGNNPAYDGIDPVSIQAGLRGQNHVATTPGYMAGMQPEFSYFQDDLENIQVPQGFTQEQLMAPYNTKINRSQIPAAGSGSYFSDNTAQKKPNGMAAGGQVPIQMGGEQAMINGGGIAEVPTDYNQPLAAPQASNPELPMAQPEAGGQPSEQDITLLASALMGENPEHADKIVEAFVKQYGPDKFAEIRQQILQMIQGPNAQTEGMIQGQGGGMDDQVMGTIGAEQPVAVSPGEYIVPADVVSGLGDGSSDAGAAELDQMQSNVRMARGGGTNQPPSIDARKMMPA